LNSGKTRPRFAHLFQGKKSGPSSGLSPQVRLRFFHFLKRAPFSHALARFPEGPANRRFLAEKTRARPPSPCNPPEAPGAAAIGRVFPDLLLFSPPLFSPFQNAPPLRLAIARPFVIILPKFRFLPRQAAPSRLRQFLKVFHFWKKRNLVELKMKKSACKRGRGKWKPFFTTP